METNCTVRDGRPARPVDEESTVMYKVEINTKKKVDMNRKTYAL